MKYCAACGQELPDYAAFCGNCGGAVSQEPIPAEKPKKKRAWLLPVVLSAAVLAAVAVVGWLTNWFGLVSPLHGLSKAVARTAAADSYTLRIVQEIENENYTNTQKRTVRQVIDEDEEEVTTYSKMEYEVHYGNEKDTYDRVYTVTNLITNDTEYGYCEYDDSEEYAYTNELEDYSKKILDQRKSIEDIDWEEFIEQLGWESVLDADEMEDFIEDLYKECLSDKRWLEKKMGFSRKGNTYTFKPDAAVLFEEIIDIVNESDAFQRAAQKEIEEKLTDLLEDLEDNDADLDVELSFTVKGRYLSAIHMLVKGEIDGEEGRMEMDITLSDVGKTEISKDEIRRQKNRVNDWIDEHYCDECDASLANAEVHGDCPYCGGHGDLNYSVDGEDCCYDCYIESLDRCELCGAEDSYYSYGGYDKLCYSCYYAYRYDYGICEFCNDFEKMYDYYGYELCWDCYYELKY